MERLIRDAVSGSMAVAKEVSDGRKTDWSAAPKFSDGGRNFISGFTSCSGGLEPLSATWGILWGRLLDVRVRSLGQLLAPDGKDRPRGPQYGLQSA